MFDDFSLDPTGWRESDDALGAHAKSYMREHVAFNKRADDILAGEQFPTVNDLIEGHPPYRDDLQKDIELYVARSRGVLGAPESLRADLRDFDVFPSADGATRIFDACTEFENSESEFEPGFGSIRWRAAWYGMIFGSNRMRDQLFCAYRSAEFRRFSYRLGAEYRSVAISKVDEWTPRWQADTAAEGLLMLRQIAASVTALEWMREHHGSVERFVAGRLDVKKFFALLQPDVVATPELEPKPAPAEPESSGEDAHGNVENDDARLAALLDNVKKPKLRIIAKIVETGTSDQRAFMKGFSSIAERGTKLVVAHDVERLADDLAAEWPHAVDVVHRVLADVREGKAIRMRPVLLIGSPGCGKTSLLTAVANRLGLASITFPCASVADGSFGGTPAQWTSRRASTPLELIRRSQIANPVVILDELEKTGTSSHNGSLVHALLPMLERHSAETYFETSLEVPVNLSGVNFLATANDLDPITEPLRDRFRVIRMPDASLDHLPALADAMAIAIFEERGLQMWTTDNLAPDELEVIGAAWGGGSLRKLKSAVEATMDLRDRLAVRQ